MKPNHTAGELIELAGQKDELPSFEALPDIDPELDLAEHKLQYEVDELNQKLAESRDTHKLRIGYANRLFVLICVWLAFVFLTIVFKGFSFHEFHLSDKVLITFISATTLNVIGLFAIVAKWMFPPNGSVIPKKRASAGKLI